MQIFARVLLSTGLFAGTLAAHAGDAQGRVDAAKAIQAEARAVGMPDELYGVRWLDTIDEVRAKRPQAVADNDSLVTEPVTYGGRDARVAYRFKQQVLLQYIVTFSQWATPADIAKAQDELAARYGAMEPFAALPGKGEESVRCSSRQAGRFRLEHCLRDEPKGVIEQIMIYRTLAQQAGR